MGQTLRFWSPSVNFPAYEVGELGEIRKIGDDYKRRLPQFWGRLDNTDPEWLVTLLDEEGDMVTVAVYDVANHVGWPEGKYEN
jgi:hypothetical protein